MLAEAVEGVHRGHSGGFVRQRQVLDHGVQVLSADDGERQGVVLVGEGDRTDYDPPCPTGTAGAVRDVSDARRAARWIW